jgi:hypothetical protein
MGCARWNRLGCRKSALKDLAGYPRFFMFHDFKRGSLIVLKEFGLAPE